MRKLIFGRVDVKTGIGTHEWNRKPQDITSNSALIVRSSLFYNSLISFSNILVADTSQQPSYINIILTAPSMLFTKITFLLMYLQLFNRIKPLRFCIYAGMVITSGFYVSVAVAQIYFETPSRHESFWSHRIGPLGKNSLILSVPLSAAGIVIDFYILILPIAVVLRLQLVKRQKVGLYLVFGTGSM